MAGEFVVSFLLVASALSCILLAMHAWTKSRAVVRLSFSVIMAMTALLAISYLMELTSADLDSMLFWNNVEYIANVSMVPLYLVFVLRYTNLNRYLKPRHFVLLWAVPLAVLVLVMTDPIAHLYYSSVQMDPAGFTGWTGGLDVVPGPGYWVWVIYTAALLFVGWVTLVSAYFNSNRFTRKQVGTVLVGITLPLVAFAIRESSFLDVEFTFLWILSFVGTGILCFVAMVRYDLFSVFPVAMDVAFEGMDDTLIILDDKDRVLHANQSALDMIGTKDRSMVAGKGIFEVLGLREEDLSASGQRSFTRHKGTEQRYYELRVNPLRNNFDVIQGRLLIIRDMTEEERNRQALERANFKLGLVSHVTRGDVQGQLTAIRGFAELVRLKGGEKVSKHADSISKCASNIEHHMEFARDYEKLGLNAPEWLRVKQVFAMSKSLSNASLRQVNVKLEDVEVYADRMLERAFQILLNYSARQGIDVKEIRFSGGSSHGQYRLIYEDDGKGLGDNEKQTVFEIGEMDEMRLHLVRQILGLTGMTIIENGIAGEGARFEIIVPENHWRVAPGALGAK